MKIATLFFLTALFIHSQCQAVEISTRDLGGLWQTELAGFVYTFGVDSRTPEKVVFALGTKAKGLAAEEIESGSLEIFRGSVLRFHVIDAENNERRVREFVVSDLSGDVLTLTWDNPPLEGVKLQRVRQEKE